MVSRPHSYWFLCLLPLLQAAYVPPSTGHATVGTECNGECKNLSDCYVIANNFNGWFNRIKFCDQPNSIVCCPKKKEPVTIGSRGSFSADSKVFVRECSQYHKEVYPKCDPLPLIISGTKAEPKEFPHMARLGVKRENGNIKWECGGTLIHPSYVLSAAHCFHGSEIPNHVRLGDLDFSSTTDDAQPQDIAIKNYIPHPEYDLNLKYNDIVLVELTVPATLNRYVAPACLPLSNGTEYAQFTAAGWGATANSLSSEHLLKATLDRFDDEKCKAQNTPTDIMNRGLLVRTQICAGSFTDKRDTCQGDSGGPLFVQHPEFPCMYLLIGVTSYGAICGSPGIAGVYMRVTLYVDWIEKVVWNAQTEL